MKIDIEVFNFCYNKEFHWLEILGINDRWLFSIFATQKYNLGGAKKEHLQVELLFGLITFDTRN